MMQKATMFSAFVLCGVLAGCVTTGPAIEVNQQVVGLDKIINSLKCGLGRAAELDTQNRSGLSNAVAVVELNVDQVTGLDTSGNVSVGIPIGKATLSPSFVASDKESTHANTTIKFDIQLAGGSSRICTESFPISNDAGFSAWFGGVVDGVNKAVVGAPKAKMKAFEFNSDFSVEKTSSSGLGLEIVAFKAGIASAQNYTFKNTMKITLDVSGSSTIFAPPP